MSLKTGLEDLGENSGAVVRTQREECLRAVKMPSNTGSRLRSWPSGGTTAWGQGGSGCDSGMA